MDPDRCLAKILEKIQVIQDAIGAQDDGPMRRGEVYHHVKELAPNFAALNGWLCGGGELPVAWRKCRNPDRE